MGGNDFSGTWTGCQVPSCAALFERLSTFFSAAGDGATKLRTAKNLGDRGLVSFQLLACFLRWVAEPSLAHNPIPLVPTLVSIDPLIDGAKQAT